MKIKHWFFGFPSKTGLQQKNHTFSYCWFPIKNLRPIWPFIFLFGIITACQTAPITGRSQLILISPQKEIELGLASYKAILKNATLSSDPAVTKMVQEIGMKLAKASNQADFEWEFNVIEDDKMINAFALPGGKVAVYTGILPYTKNEAGMATVLGHELGHVIARHGAERVSSGLLAQLGLLGLNLALERQDSRVVQSINQAYGAGVQVGILLPFNRTQESEGDHIGLILMAKAGYDPREAIGFWKRMSHGKKNKPPEFLSTHPSDERRIKQIESLLPEAFGIYQSSASFLK